MVLPVRRHTQLADRHLGPLPTGGENVSDYCSTVNKVWEAIGFHHTTWGTMSVSWPPSTQKTMCQCLDEVVYFR